MDALAAPTLHNAPILWAKHEAKGAGLVKCFLVQFPPEAVREIAQLLSQSDLGEVSFEAGKGQRLTLKRKPKFVGVAAPVSSVEVNAPQTSVVLGASASSTTQATSSEAIIIASPCVGVFHAAKTAVEVGAPLQRKQLLGSVESLKVPNEIYAPAPGVVAQVLVSDGQGVEWGQPLFEIQPGETS